MLDAYSTWLHTLPLWSRPAIATAIPSFAVLAALMIYNRISLHRRGEEFTPSKGKPAGMVAAALLGGAAFYFRDKYPLIPLILDWPNRTFPYYRAHGMTMWLGFLAAGLVARMVSAAFAALFLRGGGRRSGVPMGGFQPVAPPVYIGRVWHRSTRTTYEDE